MGFKIAMDDLGAVYSGLRLWSEFLPDYVKVDRHFIENIDKDTIKHNFVRSLLSMSKVTNCRIIAEGGIQTKDRTGKPCFYLLLSVSIGLVAFASISQCQTHIEIADLLTEAKSQAKKIKGNSYFLNQRAHGIDTTTYNIA